MDQKLIDEMQSYYKQIKDKKTKIAELKKIKAIKKAPLWEEVSGTVDAKKDFIKSQTADIDEEIALCEVEVEYAYNMVDILNWRLMYDE